MVNAQELQNAEMLKQATAKLWVDAVQWAIKNAWLTWAAIRTIQDTSSQPANQPVVTKTWTMQPTPAPVQAPVVSQPAQQPVIQQPKTLTNTNNVTWWLWATAPWTTPKPTVNQPTNQPTPNLEKTTVQWPEGTTTTTKETPWQTQLPQSIEEWKNQGSNISTLEQMIEKQYGTVATNNNWVLSANIWGQNYQWTIDNAWNPIKTLAPQSTNSNQILDTMLSGQQITDPNIKNSADYKTAIKSYGLINSLKLAWWTQITDAINSWIITEWSPEFIKLWQLNPQWIAEYTKIKQDDYKKSQINGKTNLYGKILNNWTTYDENKSLSSQKSTTPPEPTALDKINEKITANLNDQEKLILSQSIANNPDIINKTNEVTKLQWDVKTTQDSINNLEDDIRKQYAWTNATEWYILGKVSVVSKDLYKKLNSQNTNLQTQSDLLQNMINNHKSEIDQQLQAKQLEEKWLEYQGNQAFQQQNTQEARTYEEQQKQKDLQTQFEYSYWDLKSTNPQVQLVAATKMAQQIQTQYAGMPFRRDVWTMANDIVNEINSWKTSEQITTEITNAIQNAPDYANWKANNTALKTPNTADKYVNLWNWKLFNTSTQQIINTSWWSSNDLTSQINNIKTDNNVWKWTNNPWNIMGDTASQKDYAMSLWATGFYKSSNWRTYAVFPNKESWDNALTQDLQIKLSWWSTWATPQTNLADFAKWWTNWPSWWENPNATNNMIKYLKTQWVNVNSSTTIWNIDQKLLANAIQYNEWTLWQKWQDYSWLSNARPYDQITPEQKLEVWKIYANIYWKKAKVDTDKEDIIASQYLSWKSIPEILMNIAWSDPASVTKVRDDWLSDKSTSTGWNINSINMTIEHLWVLANAVKDLQNWTMSPKINQVFNAIWYNLGKWERVWFNTAANAVVSELAKVYKWSWQTNMSDIEELRWEINSDMTPAQFNNFLQTTAWLMKWRVDSLETSWKDKFWWEPPKPVLNTDAKDVLQKLWLNMWQWTITKTTWNINNSSSDGDILNYLNQ